MSLAIKLPPNNLDAESLRGNDEDYFIKRMKKCQPNRIEEGWFSNARSRPRSYQGGIESDAE